ncbi:vWA domain-containing protein [Reichenbachiella ulvae]|uniref:VWA domain-containing protein n=1 Tax=Reichenbachiella ulvae TaxID=2980104 RepID=A0ABT3CZ24_9BACT|nr:VWA domain-containing protein [Reichenbachiella ulvae]MCV9388947.1 VWA domain-containing protein [Reichenbachiella ulvae]
MLKSFLSTLLLVCYSCLVQAQSAEWSTKDQELVKSLNQEVDLINLLALKTYKNGRNYHRYNERLNQKVTSDAEITRVPRFYFTPVLLPTADFEKEKKQLAQYLEGSTLEQLLDSLWSLQKAQNQTGSALADLTQEQPELNDSLENQIYAHLLSLEQSNAGYRQLSLQIESLAYETIDKRTPDRNNDWSRSATALKSALDTARSYLALIRNGQLTDGLAFDTTAFSSQLRQLEESRSDNIGQIMDLGSNNGNSAPSRYDKVLFHLDRMISEFKTGKNLPLNDPSKYEYIVNHFNQAVDDYNAFARISTINNMEPAFLLQTVKEPGIYTMTRPEKKVVHPKLQSVSMEGYAINHTTLVLDVSGSMNHPSKLPVMKEALTELSSIMRPSDRLSVVIYSDDARVILRDVSFTDKAELNKLNTLESSGKTHAQKGLQLAYQIANEGMIPSGNNRIIIATDGDFDISREGLKQIRSEAKNGIKLSVFAFGSRIKNIDQLKEMADKGEGNYQSIHRQNSIDALLKELQTP